eukprot:1856642-Prymnesium_polylepis.1
MPRRGERLKGDDAETACEENQQPHGRLPGSGRRSAPRDEQTWHVEYSQAMAGASHSQPPETTAPTPRDPFGGFEAGGPTARRPAL